MSTGRRPPPTDAWATWSGFLATAIALVGLIGVFSTYAVAIPYQRGLREEAALDRALAAAGSADQHERLQALRPALAEAADRVIDGPGRLPDRVAAARTDLLAQASASAGALGSRMRLFIAVFTVGAASLGALLLRLVAVASSSSPPEEPSAS